jgi:FkbM family methyltransferase
MFKTYNAKFDNEELVALLWDGRDEYCFDIINHEWDYLYEILSRTLKRRRNAIQAGGNCGLYPLRLSQYFDRVFTFEPDPVNFFCLATNCKNNKIIKFNAAVGEMCKFVMIGNQQENNNGMSRILNEGEEGPIVYIMDIDGLCVSDVDLIMLDVEGYEYNALLGAKKTLTQNDPVVIIEVSKDEELIDKFLKSLNYENVAVMTSNSKTLAYVKKSD